MMRPFQTIELRAIAKKIQVGWLPQKPSPGMVLHLMLHSDLHVTVVYPENKDPTPRQLQTAFAPLLSDLARKFLAPRLLQLAAPMRTNTVSHAPRSSASAPPVRAGLPARPPAPSPSITSCSFSRKRLPHISSSMNSAIQWK